MIIKLTFGLFITRSINITRGCTRSPLSKLQHTYCFLPVSPDKSPGPDTNKSLCLLSLVLPHKEYSCFFTSQVLKLPCKNQLSISFSPYLTPSFFFFFIFCIGSHGNKSVGRESVTLILAFCTIQNLSSDPQASVI